MLIRILPVIRALKRRTVASGTIFQEIKATSKGLSYEIYLCIRDVEALERDLEVCSSEVFLDLSGLISSTDRPPNNLINQYQSNGPNS